MNRRSLLKSLLASCAALVFPWRKLPACEQTVQISDPKCIAEVPWKQCKKERRVARIRRLLNEGQSKYAPCSLGRLQRMWSNIKTYQPTVVSEDRFGPVKVFWFESFDTSGKTWETMIPVGTVLVDKMTADSIDDNTLSKSLMDAFLLAIEPQQPGTRESYCGRMVWIKHVQSSRDIVCDVAREYDF